MLASLSSTADRHGPAPKCCPRAALAQASCSMPTAPVLCPSSRAEPPHQEMLLAISTTHTTLHNTPKILTHSPTTHTCTHTQRTTHNATYTHTTQSTHTHTHTRRTTQSNIHIHVCTCIHTQHNTHNTAHKTYMHIAYTQHTIAHTHFGALQWEEVRGCALASGMGSPQFKWQRPTGRQ